jgi:hypothetical protein
VSVVMPFYQVSIKYRGVPEVIDLLALSFWPS